MLGVTLNFPILYIFILTIFISALIFWIGGKISQKSVPSEEKLLPYTGGEKFEHELVPVNIKLFDYALLFIVFDVISLVLFFSMGAVESVFGTISKIGVLLYVIITVLALYYFVRRL
ncbi:MAG: NADH-quinone oxidoreductase subunit A [Nitrososphaeria archaeon]|nr:NADH-quinone oxidoreductase subunit A [Nitrososphaeria archaeon]